MFNSQQSGKWKVDKICSMHLLLPCEVLTMVSYLRMESLLVLCAEVTPLGAKVQCHATQPREAGFIEKTVSNKETCLLSISVSHTVMLIFISVMDKWTILSVSGHGQWISGTADILYLAGVLLCVYTATHASVSKVSLNVQADEAFRHSIVFKWLHYVQVEDLPLPQLLCIKSDI